MNKKKKLNGALHSKLKEPELLLELQYPITWKEPRVDLRELANFHYVHKWSRKQLAEHYGRTEGAIQNYFQKIKKKGTLPD